MGEVHIGNTRWGWDVATKETMMTTNILVRILSIVNRILIIFLDLCMALLACPSYR